MCKDKKKLNSEKKKMKYKKLYLQYLTNLEHSLKSREWMNKRKGGRNPFMCYSGGGDNVCPSYWSAFKLSVLPHPWNNTVQHQKMNSVTLHHKHLATLMSAVTLILFSLAFVYISRGYFQGYSGNKRESEKWHYNNTAMTNWKGLSQRLATITMSSNERRILYPTFTPESRCSSWYIYSLNKVPRFLLNENVTFFHL